MIRCWYWLDLKPQKVPPGLYFHEKSARIVVAFKVGTFNPLILDVWFAVNKVSILVLKHFLLHALHEACLEVGGLGLLSDHQFAIRNYELLALTLISMYVQVVSSYWRKVNCDVGHISFFSLFLIGSFMVRRVHDLNRYHFGFWLSGIKI